VLGENRNKNGPIRVLLADDHTMFRQGLAGVLASYGDMEIIAEVPNDADALELARELSPDVVIMQVQMPFSRAVETLKAMRSFPDPPKVVIVTMFESPRYVLKSTSAEHLVAAVRAARAEEHLRRAPGGCSQGSCARPLERERGGGDAPLDA
jgi:DNA-binding NarL/FixJ family response regulator